MISILVLLDIKKRHLKKMQLSIEVVLMIGSVLEVVLIIGSVLEVVLMNRISVRNKQGGAINGGH